jgi:ABC-type transporter Mla subunit MlaD
MKTERLVVLVTPRQKRAIAHRARALDVSVGELLRRSAEGPGGTGDEAALGALASELHKAVKDSRAALRAALADAQATLAALGKRRRERRAA